MNIKKSEKEKVLQEIVNSGMFVIDENFSRNRIIIKYIENKIPEKEEKKGDIYNVNAENSAIIKDSYLRDFKQENTIESQIPQIIPNNNIMIKIGIVSIVLMIITIVVMIALNKFYTLYEYRHDEHFNTDLINTNDIDESKNIYLILFST